jgi:hypothetical protein
VPKLNAPNDNEEGARLIPETVPVPDSGTGCGDAGALSLKDRLALRAPEAAGVKVTPISQKAAGANVAPQVFDEMWKSEGFVPVKAMAVIVSVPVPLFVRRVESGTEVVLTGTEPNGRLVGVKLAPA